MIWYVWHMQLAFEYVGYGLMHGITDTDSISSIDRQNTMGEYGEVDSGTIISSFARLLILRHLYHLRPV